jgi:hypothetical protein
MAIPNAWERFTTVQDARDNAEAWGRLTLEAIASNDTDLVQQRAELAGTCARIVTTLEARHVHQCPVEGCANFCRCNCEHPHMVWMCPACDDADRQRAFDRMAGF